MQIYVSLLRATLTHFNSQFSLTPFLHLHCLICRFSLIFLTSRVELVFNFCNLKNICFFSYYYQFYFTAVRTKIIDLFKLRIHS